MQTVNLFCTSDREGNQCWTTNQDLLSALKRIEADQCDLLFIHTDIASFGAPNPSLRRRELLSQVYHVIEQLKVKTILFPAFTFSFANQEDFSVNDSTAKYMGALNEFARKQPGAVRSLDPMMSVVALGEEAEQFYRVGKQCMGEGGIFSMLHNHPNVKFLFLGANPIMCFTYAHYVEALHKVPYRFEKWYTGKITDGDGNTYEDRCSVFAACQGVTPAAMYPFEKHMEKNQYFKRELVGSSEVVSFWETDAYKAMWDALDENIHGFLAKPFTAEDLVHEVKHNPGRTVMVP